MTVALLAPPGRAPGSVGAGSVQASLDAELAALVRGEQGACLVCGGPLRREPDRVTCCACGSVLRPADEADANELALR